MKILDRIPSVNLLRIIEERTLITTKSGGHETFMRRAIELARGNLAAPFAVILGERDTGQVGAEGINRHTENPT